MEIQNSNTADLSKIFELYRIASKYMASKNQVAWPEFSRDLIVKEIEEQRQWKLIIGNTVAFVWAIALSDKSIWGSKNEDPSVYVHRIATSPDFRGQKLVKYIVRWADEYCLKNNLNFVRMDTVGVNKGLIGHYQKFGFEHVETKKLAFVDDLPDHYKEGPVCLFEKRVIKQS